MMQLSIPATVSDHTETGIQHPRQHRPPLHLSTVSLAPMSLGYASAVSCRVLRVTARVFASRSMLIGGRGDGVSGSDGVRNLVAGR
ncbi:hypothetical protein [Ferrimicrobium sp.]|uniref:hypothetical protein n=1 Tax=Ferrimicrobium sp. TaxID=2926050 RepID=UPI00261AE970|nr:hypothetical protein [Ferrimicrobium sp.]